jgi:putative ABC transport system permease protein
MNPDDYVRAWGSTDASALEILLAPGISPALGLLDIRRALGPNSGLIVETARQREQQWLAASHAGLARLGQIRILMLIAAVLAIAGALGSMIWQRRPLLRYIKRQGYTTGVLWRALLCESALLLGAGCMAGAALGLYGQILETHALASVTGFPVVIALGPALALVSFTLVCVAAVTILALPGYLAVRVRPTTVSPA